MGRWRRIASGLLVVLGWPVVALQAEPADPGERDPGDSDPGEPDPGEPDPVEDGYETVDPGERGYWIWLQDLSSPQATLSPSFDPKISEYTLTLIEEGITSVSLNFLLDLSKYRITYSEETTSTLPNVFVDGKQLVYSPLEKLHTEIELPKTYAPIKRDVHIKVADPSPDAGFVTSLFAKPRRKFEYVVKIRKLPEYKSCIKATAMSVRDSAGQELVPMPRFDPNSRASNDEYRFVLPRETSRVTVQGLCPTVDGSSSQTYNGKRVAAGSNLTVDMHDALLRRVLVACKYRNYAWLGNDYERVYTLDLDKHVESSEATALEASLVPLQNYGYCETVPADDYRLMGSSAADDMSLLSVRATSGFVCRVDSPVAVFVATYSSAVESLLKSTLVNVQTGEGTPMSNAMPHSLRMTRERQYFDLHVEAGDVAVDYPVVMIWPATCSSLECPALQATKPTGQNVAKERMCAQEGCSIEDIPHCCAPRAACDSYPHACPAYQELTPNVAEVLCKGTACAHEDEDTCCAWVTTTTTTATSTTSSSTTSSSSTTMSATSSTTTSWTVTQTSITETVSSTTVTGPPTTTNTTTSTSLTSSTSSTTTGSRTSSTSRTQTGTGSETSTTSGTTTGTSTTSSTASSSTTTSTSMFCVESNVVWTPLDLPNAAPTVEVDQQACQDRCYRNPWCRHWAFWTNARHCHLQGENATRNHFGFGFTSGPPECLPLLTITSTTTPPLANNFQCVKEGVSWEPTLGTPGFYTGNTQENVQLCQSRCARFPGCAHFVLDSITGWCKLAGATAYLVQSPVSWLSGPPHCNELFYEELSDLILRKFEGTARQHQHRQIRGFPAELPSHGALHINSTLATATMVLLVFGMVAAFWRCTAALPARAAAPGLAAERIRRTTYLDLAGASCLAEEATE